jgi:hypothetical protein
LFPSDGAGIICQAGGLLLLETLRATGLEHGLSAVLERWRLPRATHDPGKVLCDLAVTLALGGDCLADIAVLRPAPEVFGPVASDPTVSRLITALATAGPKALRAIRQARAQARARAWALAGDAAPGADGGLIPVDLDATIVIAHSDKEQAAPTWKKSFGFHPMTAFIDDGASGTGEAAALVLRRGNAGSNTAEDHIIAGRLALAQLPPHLHKQVLIRTDSGGGTHEFLNWVAARRLKYSIGFNLTDDICEAILALPKDMWQVAYDADGQVRDGAWVAELTGMLDLSRWPKGMRVIVGKERPHPGAQLRFTDLDGHRFTCFVTGTRPGGKHGQLADLELRHRRRARCEDRIRCAKDTGLRNLPLHGFAQNQVWLELIALASELLAWTQMLAPGRPSRPPLGTQTPAPARLVHSRTPGQRRATAPAPPLQPVAMGRPHRLRHHPPADTARTLTTTHPPRQPLEGDHPGRGTPPTRRDSRAATLTTG